MQDVCIVEDIFCGLIILYASIILGHTLRNLTYLKKHCNSSSLLGSAIHMLLLVHVSHAWCYIGYIYIGYLFAAYLGAQVYSRKLFSIN